MGFIDYKGIVQLLSPAPSPVATGAVVWQSNMQSLADHVSALEEDESTLLVDGMVPLDLLGLGSLSNSVYLRGDATWSTLPTATVTAVTSANGLTLTSGTLAFSGAAYSPLAGSASIVTVGTLSAGSIPYSLLTGTPAEISGANPTGTIGLTAVNGSATTFLRSDGSPEIDQTISPTWTGLHTFNASLVVTAGKVGIGTASPGSLLDITGSVGDDTTTDILRLSNNAYSSSGRAALSFRQIHSGSDDMDSAQISSSPGGNFLGSKLFFSVADGAATLQDRMIIDSNGNFYFNGLLGITAIPAPSIPGLYVDSADNKLKYRGSSGTVTVLANP